MLEKIKRICEYKFIAEIYQQNTLEDIATKTILKI